MTETKRYPAGRRLLRELFCGSICFAGLLGATLSGVAQDDPSAGSKNKPERLEWFRDQGFGLFIHWSVDGQLGAVISHSLVGASPDYATRFFTELPKTFNPTRFDADEIARVAKLAGVKYVMFTTKHHSGFTMFRSRSTPFGVAATPFQRDPTAELFNAFRKQGMAAGVYFSPDDFWWLHEHGKAIRRLVPEVQPGANPGLLAYDSAQLTELLTRYGKVDLAYFDGEAKDLREVAWKLNPEIVVTRGAFDTPELNVPSTGVAGPWEASITMGTAWQYQPDNEVYKSGHELIRLLFQTRAKGGNLLLNVGPKPNGELAIEQENRLREIGLWMMVNSECIYGVRPWIVPNETVPGATNDRDHVWFTRKREGGALYAILDTAGLWERGTWREYTLHTVKATAGTTIEVLGQDDMTVEYKPDLVPKSTVQQQADGLHIRVNRAQRLQDNSRWPNAVVVKLIGVEAALTPPRVATQVAPRPGAGAPLVLRGDLVDLGDATTLQVGFEYRPLLAGEDANVRSGPWTATTLRPATVPGGFSLQVNDLPAGTYEYHALVKHPLLTVYGADRTVAVGRPVESSGP